MPPGNQRAARVVVSEPGEWTNRHMNITQPINRLYDVWNPPPPVNDLIGDMRLTIAAVQDIIAEADRDGTRLRAIGGGWSLSRVVATNGRLINTRPMNWFFPLGAQSVSRNYTEDRQRLLYLQCGVSVQEANEILFSRGLALKTSGASNGQTIAGAVATGTHGSAFKFGAMQDYVVGLHIIVSPTRVVWLERASYPVVSDDFLNRLGAEPIRNDELFNAALVSFGSFGLVHGMLIEATPLYKLEASRQLVPLDARLRHAMKTLDFSGLQLPRPTQTPHHFEVVVNPHDLSRGAYLTTMYRTPCPPGYQPTVRPTGGLGPGDDLLAVAGTLTDFLPGSAALAVNGLVGQVYPVPFDKSGAPGEIFSTTTSQGKAMSTEIGVPLERTVDALDIMLAEPSVKDFAGFLAFRYVKASKATLAFTKYDITCTIELPAAFSAGTEGYFNKVWEGFERAEIPYTLHWGQMNNFTPDRLRTMYGDAAIDSWIDCRNQLLDPRMRAVFTSPFLQSCGLG